MIVTFLHLPPPFLEILDPSTSSGQATASIQLERKTAHGMLKKYYSGAVTTSCSRAGFSVLNINAILAC